MNKYYFPTTGIEPDIDCTQECKIKKVMIGSVKCQECIYCIESGGDYGYIGPEWIICKIIDEAKGNN